MTDEIKIKDLSIQERGRLFSEELKALLGKYNVELVPSIQIIEPTPKIPAGTPLGEIEPPQKSAEPKK